MTDEQRERYEQVKARLSRVSPGKVYNGSDDAPETTMYHGAKTLIIEQPDRTMVLAQMNPNFDLRHDASFMAHAYEDIPALLSIIDAQAKELAKVQAYTADGVSVLDLIARGDEAVWMVCGHKPTLRPVSLQLETGYGDNIWWGVYEPNPDYDDFCRKPLSECYSTRAVAEAAIKTKETK